MKGGVRGRPWLGWIDSVKAVFGKIGMTLDDVQQCATDRKEWREPWCTCV